MVIAVKTYKEMLFKQNGQDVTIKVGDLTAEGLVVGAIYDYPQTEEKQILLTTQEPLSDWTTWYEGQDLIAEFNQKRRCEGKNIRTFENFRYAHGYTKPIDQLNMMYLNKEEIGIFKPTDKNLHCCVHAAAVTVVDVAYQDFDDGYRSITTKDYKGAVFPVITITVEEIIAKQITFAPRQLILEQSIFEEPVSKAASRIYTSL